MGGKKTTGDKVGYRKPPKSDSVQARSVGQPERPAEGGKVRADRHRGNSRRTTYGQKSWHATESMSPFEVGVRQLVKRALSKNDLKAVMALIRLCESYGIIAPIPPPEQSGGVLIVPKTWDRNEWLQMFEQHGPPPWPGKRSGLVDEPRDGPNQGER